MTDPRIVPPEPPPEAPARPPARPRSWRGWVLLAVWITALAIFFEYAVRSAQELEPQAAVIAAIIFISLLLGGLVFTTLRRIEEEEKMDWL